MLSALCRLAIAAALGCASSGTAAFARASDLRQVGVARVDITPSYRVRLAGYAARKAEAEGVAQHIFAKALAIGSDREKPAVLITVDNCGVPANVREEVAARLKRERRIAAERLTICSTHTHSAPWLNGYLPNLFLVPLTAEEQAHRNRYTRELTDWLVQVAEQALDSRQLARLAWGQTQAGFAANRRTKGGPVDHALPVMFVSTPEGKLRAVFASYACHCTTLTGEYNQICGDWAGFAAEALEQDHAGAVALIALGCAGDANPNPRPGFEFARRHGHEIASVINCLATNRLASVGGKLSCRTRTIQLPYDTLPSRAEWEARAKETNYIGSHARLNLARLDRGEKLPRSLPYLVQTWTFGNSLALVFLPGEVVVDYSLGLKQQLDARRAWINAYANDVPCYIPSERVLKEGGYEGGGAMVYYDRPNRFAAGIEDRIVKAVRHLTPRTFLRHSS